MSRTRAVVFGPEGAIIYIEENALDSELVPNGGLQLSGENTGVVFAPGHWSIVTSTFIEE